MNIGICMLKTYRTYNPTVEFLKYKFNTKLLGGVTLLRFTLNVTDTRCNITQSYIRYNIVQGRG